MTSLFGHFVDDIYWLPLLLLYYLEELRLQHSFVEGGVVLFQSRLNIVLLGVCRRWLVELTAMVTGVIHHNQTS